MSDDRLAAIEQRMHHAGVGLMTDEVEWLIAEAKQLAEIRDAYRKVAIAPNRDIRWLARGHLFTVLNGLLPESYFTNRQQEGPS